MVAVVLASASYVLVTARKTVSNSRPFFVAAGGPMVTPPKYQGETYSFCPPSNALGGGAVWFTWGIGGSGSNGTFEVIGPVPVNHTVYHTIVPAGGGWGRFEVALYASTDCGTYFFGMEGPTGEEINVFGDWNYTTSVPII
jgi:hypothetical protein